MMQLFTMMLLWPALVEFNGSKTHYSRMGTLPCSMAVGSYFLIKSQTLCSARVGTYGSIGYNSPYINDAGLLKGHSKDIQVLECHKNCTQLAKDMDFAEASCKYQNMLMKVNCCPMKCKRSRHLSAPKSSKELQGIEGHS